MSFPFPEYEDFDATALAGLIATGEMKPREIVEAAIARIEAHDPRLNAVVWRRFDDAIAEAATPREGPFGGVPFLIKDLTPEEGIPTTFGSVLFRNYVGEVTPEAILRFRRSGLISLGRTNTPEFGLLPTTEPTLFGPTHNPWNAAHSSGGSSGGAAAAVAAGMVPMAMATDGGGSIRIPASACGLFGLKPSRSRVPGFPPHEANYVTTTLCVSRSVRDTARLLDAIHGHVPGDRFRVPLPQGPFADASTRDPEPLRIAFTLEDFHGRKLHPDCRRAVRQTARILEQLGHVVEETRPDLEAGATAAAFLQFWQAMPQAAMLEVVDVVAKQTPVVERIRNLTGELRALKTVAAIDKRRSGMDALEPFTWQLIEASFAATPGDLLRAETHLQKMSYRLADFFEEWDLLLTSTLGSPPVPLGAIDQAGTLAETEEQLNRYVPFTPIANFAGVPAMSVPLTWTVRNLPIGSHFIAPMGAEDLLLSLAGQLERAQPWFERRPPLGEAAEPDAASDSFE